MDNNYGVVFEALCVRCLICGETVTTDSVHETVKICDKCKEAVMKVRKEMEGK